MLVSESDNTFRLRESLSVDGMKEIIENHALSVNDFLFHKDDRVSVLPVADAREIVAAYNAIKNSEAFMSDAISLRDMVIISNYPANPRFHYYKYPQAVVLSRLFARQIAETKSPRGRLQQIRNLVLDPYDEADDTGCFMAKCDLGFFNNQQQRAVDEEQDAPEISTNDEEQDGAVDEEQGAPEISTNMSMQ